MAERFSSRSLFSIVSSPESDSKSSRSSSGGQPSNSTRRPRRPPEQEMARDGRTSTPVPNSDRASRPEVLSHPKSNPSVAKGIQHPKSKVENLQAIADNNGRKKQKSPTAPRSNNRADSTQRRKVEPATVPIPKTRPQNLPYPGPGPQPKNRVAKRPRRRGISPLVYATRLLILGVGIAVLAGTVISVLNSFSHATSAAQEIKSAEVAESPSPSPSPITFALQLNQEMVGLKAEINKLAAQNSNFTPGVFIVDLDTGGYANVSSDAAFPAASTIKVPILVAFFQAVDEGRVRLDQMLTLRSEDIASGSGELQDQPPGRKFTALEVATKMIAISDNTATNMLIELLGGVEALNQRFQTWGLTVTSIRNKLPDLEGTNTTSPRELVNLIAQINQGSLVSLRSRDRLLYIMRQTENDSLLPRGLGEGAIIAHKTGNINSLAADVGMVDMPNGKRYLVAVMVKYAKNEKGADKLIRDISRTTYQYLDQGESADNSKSSP
ncbi:MAG TPA: serine hydrolase [Kamptonema sp.]|nr:serine hydrolase [Kamptonema sp.]